MKYLKDPNNIISKFPKYVLIYDDLYEAVAYLLRDVLYELSIKINRGNMLTVIGLFQDIFDILNPYVNNIFSAFDVNEEYTGFNIMFLNDDDDFTETGELIKRVIKIEYRE